MSARFQASPFSLPAANRPARWKPVATALCALALLGPGVPAGADDSAQVEHCSKNFGTLAVAEPETGWGFLQQYGLGSPAALLRSMIQQSGCFDVVERGVGMKNIQQERALAEGGELQSGSNLGKGQMAAADFVLTPTVQMGAKETGGIGGGLLGGLGRIGGLLGAVAGGVKFKEASTSIMIADVRSSIQVASEEGKATKTDFSISGWALGAGGVGGLGGYTSTPEGKMLAASFLDNYNKIVVSIRDRDQLMRSSSAASKANAAGSIRAEAPQQAGQMLTPKLASVKVYADASRDAQIVATLQRGEELVATGEVKNGFVQIDSANASGWVQRTLVAPLAGAADAAPAPPPAPAPAPVAAARNTLGGTFSGADNGTFQLSYEGTGVLMGQGASARSGMFQMTGRVDAGGNAVLAVIRSGQQGMVFRGRIDPAVGTFAGDWQFVTPDGKVTAEGGTFVAQRQ